MNDNKTEYVYCMSNKSFNRDLVKIGWTKNEPKKRAQQLYTTGVPNPFTIEFIIKTPDGRSLETRIHSYFSRCRENNSREFFNISVEELRTILTEKLNLMLSDPEPEPEPEERYYLQPVGRFERCSKKMLQHFYDISATIEKRPIFFDDNLDEDLSLHFERFRYNPEILDEDLSHRFERFRYNPEN